MGYEQMMAVTAPRIAGAEAVAALTARMKLDATGEVGDPDVRHAISAAPLSDDEAVALLSRAGLSNVRSVRSDWAAPIRSVAGLRF